jgi:hypothetical protein
LPPLRKAVTVVAVIGSMLALSACQKGCTFAPQLNDLLTLGRSDFPGAKLVAPASAAAGDTITLDASGSEIVLPSTECPEIVRFFFFDPDKQIPVDTQPAAVIKVADSNSELVTEGGVDHCRLIDGKVRVKVPARPPSGKIAVAVDVESLGGATSGPRANGPKRSVATKTMTVTQGGPVEPANKPPVARFFAVNDPSVQGHAIKLDATESFDPDGTVTGYDWDFDGDGNYDLISNDPLATVPDAGSPGTRHITLRVHDNKDATAQASIDQLVVAPTTFTDGTFGSPQEVAVNTSFDLAVDNNVTGADAISLDADNDGQFDDGLPSATADPAAAQPQFDGMKYATGGWKRVAVMWQDNAPPNDFTITTHLIKVTPFENPASRRIPRLVTTAKAGTRLTATLTPKAVTPVTVRRVSLVSIGIAARGLVIRGGLSGKVSVKRLGQKVPPGIKVLNNAVFAGTLDGTVPMRPDGTYGTPTGSGLLLASARKDRRTMVCMSVKQPSATRTRFTVLGATGKASGLRASGAFPPLVLDALSQRTRSTKVAITVKTGKPKGLSRKCRALTKHL